KIEPRVLRHRFGDLAHQRRARAEPAPINQGDRRLAVVRRRIGHAESRTHSRGPEPIHVSHRPAPAACRYRAVRLECPPTRPIEAMTTGEEKMTAPIYEIPVRKIDGSAASLGEHAGKVLLVVNVA